MTTDIYKNDPIRQWKIFQGLRIGIEWPKGSTRIYRKNGRVVYRREMKADYGYLPKTRDNDLEQLDVYVGPDPESSRVFLFEQLKADGTFDEHKVFLGCASKDEAKKLYAAHLPNINRIGKVHEMSMTKFKEEFLPMAEIKKAEKPQGPTHIIQLRSDLDWFTPAEVEFNEWLHSFDPERHDERYRLHQYDQRENGKSQPG